MKLEVKSGYEAAVFGGEADPAARGRLLSEYVLKEASAGRPPRGVLVHLDPGEAAKVVGTETDPARQKELVLGYAVSRLQKQQKPRPVSAIEWERARKVRAKFTRTQQRSSPQLAKAVADSTERALRTKVHPERIEAAKSGLAPTHRGAMSALQRIGDKVDFGLSIPGLPLLVSRTALAGGVLAWSTVRPGFALLSRWADTHGLARMKPEQRRAWVASLDPTDRGIPHYQKLVAAMERVEAKNPDATPADLMGSWRVANAGTGLTWQYLRYASADGRGERDPYGGNYPRPWVQEQMRDGQPRTTDAVDIVFRGLLGLDDDQVKKWRGALHGPSAALGSVGRMAMQGVVSGVRAANDPKLTWASQYQGMQDEFDRRFAAGDTSVGMGVANLLAVIGPDMFIARGVGADLVETSLGTISRKGDRARSFHKVVHNLNAEQEAEKLLKRKLTAAEKLRLEDRVDTAVDHAFAAVMERGERVTDIRTDEALSYRLGSDGAVQVVTDPSKVKAYADPKIPDAPELFPRAAAIPSAVKKGVDMALAKLPTDGEKSVTFFRASEAARRVFGKGPRLVVKDPISNKLRLPRPTDLVGEAKWQLFRSVLGSKRRATAQQQKAAVDEALVKLFDGTSGPDERMLVREFMEVLGNPSAEAAEAGQVWSTLEERIDRALLATPAAVDDLRKRRSALSREQGFAEAALQREEARLLRHQAAERAAVATGPKEKAELAKATAAAKRAVEEAEVRVQDLKAERKAEKALAKKAKGKGKEEHGPFAATARSAAEAEAQAAKGALDAAKRDLAKARRALAKAKKREAKPKDRTKQLAQVRGWVSSAEKAKAAAEARQAKAAAAVAAVEKKLVDAEALEAVVKGKASLIGPVKPATLQDKALAALEAQAARAELVAELMGSLTGVRTAKAAVARAALGRELETFAQQARLMAKDQEIVQALDGLTQADVKQATRAMARIAKGGKKLEDLTPRAQAVVTHMRSVLDGIYESLRAAGRLPTHSREAFYERVLVEGYVPHMLSKRGRAKLRSRLGVPKSGLSTKIEALELRKLQGTVDEVNQQLRERVAEMFWEAEKQAGRSDPAEDAASAIARIIDEKGLAKDVYFETRPEVILARYAQDVGAGLANTAMVHDLINLFPEGNRFARMVGSEGLQTADALAHAAGYRRVSGMTLLRSLDPALAGWSGWKKLRKEEKGPWAKAQRALHSAAQTYSEESVDSIMSTLRALGAPLDEVVSAGRKEQLKNPVYMPLMVADELEHLSSPSLWSGIPQGIRDHLRETTAVWKMGMTIFAPAFHGRNWLSNQLAGLMTNGWDAISPSTQIVSHKLLSADDDQVIQIGSISMAAAEWRKAFRRADIIRDMPGGEGVGGLALAEGSFAARVQIAKGAKWYVGGGAVGAAGGFVSGDTPEERIQNAFGWGLFGASAGGAGSTSFDAYLRQGVQRRREALGAGLPATEALRLARDQVVTDLLDSLKEGSRTGLVFGLLGALWGAKTKSLATAAAWGSGAGLAAAGGAVVMKAAAVLAGGLGRHVEDMAKVANAVAEIKKGGGLDAAAAAAKRATFDYQDLTKVEQEVLKAVFPFYTWQSKNVGLQAWSMVHRPKEYLLLERTMRSLDDDRDVWAMEDYHAHRWLIGIGSGLLVREASRTPRFIAGMSTGPEAAVEQFSKGWRGLAASSHPLAKFALEYTSDQSMYYERPILKITSGRDYAYLPMPFKKSVGWRDDVVNRSGRRLAPQIGWYEIDRDEFLRLTAEADPQYAEQLARAATGEYLRKDLRRATALHQVYSSHPTRRLLVEMNRAFAESFRSALTDVEPEEMARLWERLVMIALSTKVTHSEPVTQAEREMERSDALMQLAEDHGIAYEKRLLPKRPSLPEPMLRE